VWALELVSTCLVSNLILDESWDCYYVCTLFKFSECFVVQGVMKGRDYVWKGEKKGAEHVCEFATGE